MSDPRPVGAVPDPQPDLLGLPDPHARALALGALRPTEALGPVDEAWLDDHLRGCEACRATADAYEADRALLQGLRDRAPQPPRDLWARTAAALEREAGRAVRIRRAAQSPRPPAPYRPPRWSPGIISGLLVVTLVAGSGLLAGLGRTLLPAPSGSGSAATPIAVSADVRWIQAGADGSYDIVLGQVDRVCPAVDPGACAPLQDVARSSIVLGAAPRSVSLSPNSRELVVVAANGAAGGAVYVVPVPAGMVRQPAASPTTTTAAPASGAVVRASGSLATGAASPAVGLGSPVIASAAPAAAIAIAEGVIVVGGTAAHSPDGEWFAFAARPADGSAGPDIYVWRAGNARAVPFTSDHRSIFSGWLGTRILGTRIDGAADSTTPRATDPATGPAASGPVSSVLSSPAASGAAPTPTPAAAASPTPTQAVPSASPTATLTVVASGPPVAQPSVPASGAPASASPSASGLASIRPGFVVAMERSGTSFLLDPVSGASEDLRAGLLRPVVDPTGRWLVYWEGTMVADAQGVDWMPGTGRLVVAPWTPPAGSAPAVGSPLPVASGRAPASATPGTAAASFVDVSSAPSIAAAAPASPARAAASPAASSGPAASPGASGRRASPAPSVAPAGPQPLVDGPMVDFDVAFDPTGTHLAVWISNPTDPSSGALTLFSLRDGAWGVDPLHRLVGVPALRGFAIADGGLVWVTPPDVAGGSRIEVAGWTSDGFGSVRSVSGGRLIVVR